MDKKIKLPPKLEKFVERFQWQLPHFPIDGPYCMVAEFETPAQIMHAAETFRDAGYKHWETHMPFPVHGIDKAMGRRRSLLPWIVLFGGLAGCAAGLGMQVGVADWLYKLNISGKPDLSIPAFIPITFECTILLSAFTAVGSMFALNLLPQLYHPLFNYERFSRVTQDRFFLSVQTRDKLYDDAATRQLLESVGGTHIAVLEP